MWVGFHDDPSYRWVNDREVRIDRSASDGSTIVRLLVQWNLVAPQRRTGPPTRSTPSIASTTSTRRHARPRRSDQEVMLTISGTPRWANGGQNPKSACRETSATSRTSRARSRRALGRNPGYPYVRFWVRLERAEPAAVPRSAVRQQGPLRRARELREAVRAPPTQGSRPATGPRRWRSARPPPAVATSRRAFARRTRPASSRELVAKANPRLKFFGLGTPPVSVDAEPPARPDRAVAERLARLPAALPAEPEALVPPEATRRSGSRSTGTRRGRRIRSA